MKLLAIVTLLALHASLCLAGNLPRSTPEAQGVSSQSVLAFVEAADKNIDARNVGFGSTKQAPLLGKVQ